MIVAIDGPAGVGKSSISKMIAKECNLYYLNSGNFYRAITLNHLRKNGDFFDKESCIQTALESKIDIVNDVFLLDGEAVENQLHNSGVDMNASYISCIPEVREIVNKRVREIAANMDVICEGRDITTVVFPNAELKFYFDASPQIRAMRRVKQNPNDLDYEQTLASIIKRDENDKNKAVGALKIAQNAIIIDTSYLTIEEVCEKVIRAVKGVKK